MGALIRFAVARTVRSQRWLPPTLCFLVELALTYAAGSPALSTAVAGAVALVPISAWLAIAVAGSQSPGHADVLVAALGRRHVRVADQLAAALFAAALVAASLVELALSSGLAAADVPPVLVVDGSAVVTGIALGAVCSPPLVRRPGWTVTLIGLVAAAELAVPYAPPLGWAIRALTADHPAHIVGVVAMVAAEALLTVMAFTIVTDMLARRAG